MPHDDSLYTVRAGLFQMATAFSEDDSDATDGGATQVGRFLGRGDHFGADALLERRHRLATVRALGAGDVARQHVFAEHFHHALGAESGAAQTRTGPSAQLP